MKAIYYTVKRPLYGRGQLIICDGDKVSKLDKFLHKFYKRSMSKLILYCLLACTLLASYMIPSPVSAGG